MASQATSAGVSVLVCRGCCCGTEAKHPGVDHPAQLARLRAALPPESRSRLFEVDCLGPCERANVVVVRSGGRRRWFGEVLAPEDTDALAGWIAAGGVGRLPAALHALRFEPDEVTAPLVEDPRTGDELADVVHAVLRDPGAGVWTVGVEGALAELDWGGEGPAVERDGRTLVAASAQARLRLVMADRVAAFVAASGEPGARVVHAVVLAVPRTSLAPATPGVTIVGRDAAAIRATDGDGTLVDLGLGRAEASFGVRVDDADPELLDHLWGVAGLSWAEASGRVGPAVVAASPTRVVRTAVARAEVLSPIPPPDGASPEGPHTHLLPALLELGRELPVGLCLARRWAPAAAFYPGPGWQLP